MSSVPLSMNQLEEIAEMVSRDLLEKWAIDDRFTEEEMEKAAQNAVDDTIFIINNFMEHFNNVMIQQSESQENKESKLII
jgi:hypothetical protein